MDRVVKTRWVERLRSGQDLQGRGALWESGRLCCLGVLCETVRAEMHLRVNSVYNTDGELTREYGSEEQTMVLPIEVANYVGINREQQNRLIGMNDEEEVGFEEIADWVEENL